MKILLINKFLYPKGGAESYIFQLADLLKNEKCNVEFWGMKDDKNIVQDKYDCFAENIDYRSSKKLNLGRVINTIYSGENRKKISVILDRFKPDIVHIHNYNFQLTPSILEEIRMRGIKIIHTIHDSQMICPFHRLYNYQEKKICTRCEGGNYLQCVIHKCFDRSLSKSIIGMVESFFYYSQDYYNKHIDAFISPSQFFASMLGKMIKKKLYVIPNFYRGIHVDKRCADKESYVLYYGRISEEKGILDIQDYFEKIKTKLIIIGNGPDVDKITNREYVEHKGYLQGSELFSYITNALCVIQPSKWFENCPMTVIESFMYGTPVIAPKKGGFIEMIDDGYSGFFIDFEKGNVAEKIRACLKQVGHSKMRENCRATYNLRYAPEIHIKKIMKVYKEVFHEN